MRTCSVPSCNRPHDAKGVCHAHYMKRWVPKSRIYTRMNGRYIRLCLPGGKLVYLHRYIWEYHFGEIPDGYFVHHKDGNPINNGLDNLQLIERGQHTILHVRRHPPEYDAKRAYKIRHRQKVLAAGREYAQRHRAANAEAQRRYTARKKAAAA